jgi:hypothetical protein
MYPTVAIQVTSVDMDVIHRVAVLFNRDAGPVKNYDYEKSFKGERQQQYRVRLYSKDALLLMLQLYPLLGNRRQAQVKNAMSLCYRLKEFLGGFED